MDPVATAPPRAIYMDLQPDWRAQRLETCWLNVYERSVRFSGGDPPSVAVESHVNTSFQLPLQGPDTSATASTTDTTAAHLVEITKRERDWMEVRADGLARVVFQAPRDTLDVFAPTPSHHGVDEQHDTEPITHRRVVRPQLLSVDVAMDEQHVVAGGADGKCTLWDLSLGSEPRPLVGHLLDVTRAVFFPSSKVVLTASLDFSLRIWSVESARCAAVLKGHSGGVTDVAVVGRGRNVVCEFIYT
jgi:WD40 repeat protein